MVGRAKKNASVIVTQRCGSNIHNTSAYSIGRDPKKI